MLSHSKSIGHDGQRRIHGAARRKEAAVDNIEIIKVVRFAIRVEGRSLRIAPKTNRAVLVRDARQRNALPDKQIAREQPLMTFMSVNRTSRLTLHETLEFGNEPLVAFLVVRLVGERDAAVAIDGNSIVGVGQVFGSEPEI